MGDLQILTPIRVYLRLLHSIGSRSEGLLLRVDTVDNATPGTRGWGRDVFLHDETSPSPPTSASDPKITHRVHTESDLFKPFTT